jgi:hypothetical protein
MVYEGSNPSRRTKNPDNKNALNVGAECVYECLNMISSCGPSLIGRVQARQSISEGSRG